MLKKLPLYLLLLIVSYPAGAAKNILIVGDSLSAGYGIAIEKSWVNLLQKRLGNEYSVQNISISGNTTSNGLASLPEALKLYSPVLTVIELGGNDGLRGLPLKTIKTQLAQMIELAKKSQSKVLLLGVRLPPNYGPEYTHKFHLMYTELGATYKISVVPLFLKGVDDDPILMQPDGIHPVSEAQLKMLDNTWECLEGILSDLTGKFCG
ncbi:MAG: arylesterase [Gammaproteobacteria bacterium]